MAINQGSIFLRDFLFAVIGGGSIGTRHARNLITLGQSVQIIETEPSRAAELRTLGFTVESELEAAFAPEVDAVLVCSPSIHHFAHTQAAIRAGKAAFIEKPISHRMDGVDDLVKQAQAAGIITLVGFNMRFRDGFKRAQALIAEGRIGKPLAVRANASYYLPHYHPDKDYRQRYQAQKRLGGGVVLDDIHELDYLTALFGRAVEVFAYAGKLSDLEIDVEDYAAITLKHASGVITQLQLDFLQRVYRRQVEVTGSQATLTLDHNTGEIRLYGPADHQYTTYPQKMSVTVNDMYLDEMQHFLDCLRGEVQSIADIAAGRNVLQLAMAVLESAETGKVIRL
jgi:predicted dehydrogenase